MNKLKFFTTLCCAALLFAACDKDNEPLNQNDPANDTKEAVDLGLSVKWATCNVGATSPEKYGNYYAWGETTMKSNYSWNPYTYGTYNDDDDYSTLTKYNAKDKKTTLETADDVVATYWGGKWRMPTDKEWKELINNCTWTWTSNYNSTGVAGYEVKATNGNSIFLPAAGFRGNGVLYGAGSDGCYWSSSLDADGPNNAWGVDFYSDDVYRGGSSRCCGLSVRPVLK